MRASTPALALLTGLLLQAPSPAQEKPSIPELQSYYWVFLVSGPNRDPAPKELLQEQQKAHVGNLGRLHAEGKCPLAGPLGSGGRLRGFVILDVKSEAEARECFKADPFVQSKRLDMEFYPWATLKGAIGKPVEPPVLQKCALVILKKGPKWSGEDTPELRAGQRAHVDYLMSLRKSGELAFAGPFSENNDTYRGVAVYRIEDVERVKALAEADPQVRAGHLAVDVHPLFVGKGTLDPIPPK